MIGEEIRESLLAKEMAEKLFKLMGDWDKFDITLHSVQSIIERIYIGNIKGVQRYYDLSELRSSARHYITTLQLIIECIDKILENTGE